ncbi:MAG: CCDC90 family protein [Zoogloeaceae bacterium]|jgi:hypothetical protein|nr:CCDC90 family protein [Zoogloeaceae bacterium]
MNTAVTFDTLAFVKKLEEKGFSDKQAEGITEALKDADIATRAEIKAEIKAAETSTKVEMKNLATKDDIREAELRIIRWVVALALGQAALIVGLMIRMLSH